ncbi:uncharacterized protein [Diadema antillarum]|uniref:uncharacterized protein n=1 Tax=Diadema antillarum TaxID=105358 RepID=UPI003A870DDA
MTGGSFIFSRLTRPTEDIANQRRFSTGYLDHIVCLKTMKAKRRWVVLQGDESAGLFQLKIFKNMDEKVLKGAFALTKDIFMGTERGVMRKPQSKHRTSAIEYWAIMLSTETILFQESKFSSRDLFVKRMASADLTSWYSMVKSHFTSESWTVYPVKGIVAPEFRMALHVTKHKMCLATLSPPTCSRAWDLERIIDSAANDVTFVFHVDNIGGDEGYCELKTESKKAARDIHRAVTRHCGRDPGRGPLPKLPSLEADSPPPPLLFSRPDLRPQIHTERYSASPSRKTDAPVPPLRPPDTTGAEKLPNNEHEHRLDVDDFVLEDRRDTESLNEETHMALLTVVE